MKGGRERESRVPSTAWPLTLLRPFIFDSSQPTRLQPQMDSNPAQHESELTYVRHCDIPLPLSINLSSLQGSLPSLPLSALLDNPTLKHTGSQQSLPTDLYLIIQLWSDNNQLIPPIQSPHKSFKSTTNYHWNQPLTLPIKYRDLPRDAQLAFTIYDIASPRSVSIIGGSTLRLFGKKATLKKGKQRLFVWKGVQADGRTESETPSKVGGAPRDEMGRLEKEVKRHERGDVTRLDWLDKLAFRQIEKIHAVRFALSSFVEHQPPRRRADPFSLSLAIHFRLCDTRPSQRRATTSSSTSICLASTFPSSSPSQFVLLCSHSPPSLLTPLPSTHRNTPSPSSLHSHPPTRPSLQLPLPLPPRLPNETPKPPYSQSWIQRL